METISFQAMRKIISIAIVCLVVAFFMLPVSKKNQPTIFSGTVSPVDASKTENGALDLQSMHDRQLQIKRVDITDPSELLKISGHLTYIDGGIQLRPSVGVPTCVDQLRGVLWFVASSNGNDDSLLVCTRLLDGTFQWKKITN